MNAIARKTPITIAIIVLTTCSADISVGQEVEPDHDRDARQTVTGGYRLVDPDLKIVHIDRMPKESLLAICVDSMGRLFVGGREAVFVYEPQKGGGYREPQLLYRFPPDSWVTGLEIRGNDLYALTLPALYVLGDARTGRANLTVARLISGPPHNAHNSFHGLAWGPQGDLYFGCGDPRKGGLDRQPPDYFEHWNFATQPQGTRIPYTGTGGVFRCRADGSVIQYDITYADKTIASIEEFGRAGSFSSADRWKRVPRTDNDEMLFHFLASVGSSTCYLCFRFHALQTGHSELLLEGGESAQTRVWHNGIRIEARKLSHLELQPGSNDILVRIDASNTSHPWVSLRYRSLGLIDVELPEKLGIESLS